MPEKRIVSFCLWGENSKYTVGAIKNAELTPVIYPGWIARFYIARTTPKSVADGLVKLGAEVVFIDQDGDWTSSFWRFHAASDLTVDRMISRDCDSRLNSREKNAVDEWIWSGKSFHIMRDHPHHRDPILAGMWGACRGVLPSIEMQIAHYRKRIDQRGTDQWFLAEVVYPLVKDDALIHDEFFQGQPFPLARRGSEFVGEIYDQFDQPDLPARSLLTQD
jgi:hypothetical protein